MKDLKANDIGRFLIYCHKQTLLLILLTTTKYYKCKSVSARRHVCLLPFHTQAAERICMNLGTHRLWLGLTHTYDEFNCHITRIK